MAGRARILASLAAGLVVLLAPSVRAAAPNFIMVYGGSLAKPIMIDVWATKGTGFSFLFGGSTSGLGTSLDGRPYVKLAMFWNLPKDCSGRPCPGGETVLKNYLEDRSLLAQIKPEEANQHGRLYPPAGNAPAVVVATPWQAGSACAADVDGHPVDGLGRPRTIPDDVKGFSCGWTLAPEDVRALHDLGVPGF